MSVRKTGLLIFFIVAVFGARRASAKLDFEDASFPELVTSARALAQGNAYLNNVDDAWAAFYNPAGLGTVRGLQFHLLNFHMEASSVMLNQLDDGGLASISSNVMKTFEAQDIREKLVDNRGKISHLRANFFPNITVRGMTLGYFLSQRNRAIVEKDSDGGDFEIAERRDHGPVFALNLPLFGGVFKLGASATYLYRRELNKSFEPADVAEIDEATDHKKGRSLQVTAGTRLTIPVAMLPTFSAVLRNATANDWENVSRAGAPDDIKQTLDVGFSITPQIGKVTRLHFEVNYKDLNGAYGTDGTRRIAAGAELGINRRIFIRGGLADGWGSGGIGVRSSSFIFDLTTYAVDRELKGFRKQEDRRFVLSLSSGF